MENALPPLHRTSIPNRRGIARRGLLQLLALDHKAWVLAEHVIDHSNERGEGLLQRFRGTRLGASAPNLHCQLAASHLEERRGRGCRLVVFLRHRLAQQHSVAPALDWPPPDQCGGAADASFDDTRRQPRPR